MVTTKITKGKSFSSAVNYDLGNGLNKNDQEMIEKLPSTTGDLFAPGFKEGERARLLDTNLSGKSPKDLNSQFKKIAKSQTGVSKPVHKVSVNLKPGEHFESYDWIDVGHSYLKEMGFENSPYMIVQHREKDHEHIHILTSRVDFEGKVVSDSMERRRARSWAKSIESKYDLTKTEEKATEKAVTRTELEQAVKLKKVPARMLLQEHIKKTLMKDQTASQFINLIEERGVSVQTRIGKENKILGISFATENRAFRGSDLGAAFSWNGLLKNGLEYNYERDFEKLKEASRRGSKSTTATNEISAIEEISRFFEFDGRQSSNETDGIHKARTGSVAERASGNEWRVDSEPYAAGADEQGVSGKDRRTSGSNKTEFRSGWGHDSEESLRSEGFRFRQIEEIAAACVFRKLKENSETDESAKYFATGISIKDGKIIQASALHQETIATVSTSSDLLSATTTNAKTSKTGSQSKKVESPTRGKTRETIAIFGGGRIPDRNAGNNRIFGGRILQNTLGNNKVGVPNVDVQSGYSPNHGSNYFYTIRHSDVDTGKLVRNSSSSRRIALGLIEGLRDTLDQAEEIVRKRLEQEETERQKAQNESRVVPSIILDMDHVMSR
ncbi:MAG: relaxase/mobilization nuclease domain-containing protein [Pyrinomonadaceae bacterium]